MPTKKDLANLRKDRTNLWSEHNDNIRYFADTYIRDFAHAFVDDFASTYALQFMEDLAMSMRDDFAHMFGKDYSEHFAEEIDKSLEPGFVHEFVREYMKFEDQGELLATVQSILNLCRSKGMTEDEAMSAMGIPQGNRIVYEAALRHARHREASESELEALEEFVIDMPDPGPDGIIHYVSEAEREAGDLDSQDARTMERIRDLIEAQGLGPKEAMDKLGVPEIDRQAYLLLLSMESEGRAGQKED